MMLERQAFRIAAIYRVYGLRSVFFGCLLPPLMPLRLIWGNIINLAATLRAYRQFNAAKRGNAKHQTRPEKRAAPTETSAPAEASAPKKLAWSKTDHQFLGKQALQRYQRNLGDILLEKGYLSIRELSSALLRAALSRQKIGAYLREHGLLSEEQLLDALSAVKHIPFVKSADLGDYAPWRYAEQFEESMLRSQLVLPLLKTKEGFVVAFCDQSPNDAQTALRTDCGCPIRAVFASQQTIEAGLTTMFHHGANTAQAESLADSLYETGAISEEQLLLFHTYRHRMGMNERDLLLQMGLVR
jgi:adsorption protein B